MSEAVESDADPTDVTDSWLKLSIWSVLYFIAKSIAMLVGNLWTLVPIVYVGVQSGTQLMVGIAALVLLAILVGAVLQYRFFRYRLTGQQVEVKQGVLNRRTTSLEFARVQNVNIEVPVYYRPLKLVTLKIDSAGSSGDEVDLSALTHEAAATIRAEIVAGRTDASLGSTEADGTQAQEADDGQLLITRSIADLVIHGLTNNRAWILAGGAFALFGQAGDRVERIIGERLSGLGDQASTLLAEQSVLIIVLVLAGFALLVVAFMSLLSVLGSILGYYDFRLLGSSDRLTVQRGLLVRRETNLRKSRVQVVVSDESWLDRVFARRNLVFEQLRQASGDGSGASAGESRAVVPSVTSAQLMSLSREIGPLPDPDTLTFESVNVRHLVRSLFQLALLTLALWIPLVLGEVPLLWGLGGSALLWLVVAPLCWLSWRRWGVALTIESGGYLVVRRGVVGVSYYTVPLHKLQQVRLSRSWFMGRRDLSHLTVTVASRALTVPMLAGGSARLCADIALATVEREQRSWM